MSKRKAKAAPVFHVAGCDCLTCRGFRERGIKPTKPKTEAEAFEHSIRPITSATRFVACATIQGARVLKVEIRPWGKS